MHDRTAMRPLAIVLVLGAVVGCTSAPARTERFELQTLNDSGVTGTVTLTMVSSTRTRVEVAVDAAGHESMPAHIHPGSCDELVPQPIHPLENVIGGVSVTEVAASLDDLLGGGQALNLHRSNAEMEIYTACVDLR
jgi:hypothetical protein